MHSMLAILLARARPSGFKLQFGDFAMASSEVAFSSPCWTRSPSLAIRVVTMIDKPPRLQFLEFFFGDSALLAFWKLLDLTGAS